MLRFAGFAAATAAAMGLACLGGPTAHAQETRPDIPLTDSITVDPEPGASVESEMITPGSNSS